MGTHCLVAWDNNNFQSTKIYDLANVLFDNYYCRRLSFDIDNDPLEIYFFELTKGITFEHVELDYTDESCTDVKETGRTTYNLPKGTKIFCFETGTSKYGDVIDIIEDYAKKFDLNYTTIPVNDEIYNNAKPHVDIPLPTVEDWYENHPGVEKEYAALEEFLIQLHEKYSCPICLYALSDDDEAQKNFNNFMCEKYSDFCKNLDEEEFEEDYIECDGFTIRQHFEKRNLEVPDFRFDPLSGTWEEWE